MRPLQFQATVIQSSRRSHLYCRQHKWYTLKHNSRTTPAISMATMWMVLPGVRQEEALKPCDPLISHGVSEVSEFMKWDWKVSQVSCHLSFSDPGRRKSVWPSIFVKPPKLFPFFPFQALTPLGEKSRSWKYYCVNKSLRITLISLTLIRSLLRKGPYVLGTVMDQNQQYQFEKPRPRYPPLIWRNDDSQFSPLCLDSVF